MSVKLLTEQHLEFLSLKGGYTGSSESTLVKIPNCLDITCHGSFIGLAHSLNAKLFHTTLEHCYTML